MEASSVSVLGYRRSKPLGKVRRRVQDLRIPSSYYYDFTAVRPMLDLSHNESTRLAVDCLLTQGVEGYQEVLNVEGEVDFLSELEKKYILENGREGTDPGAYDDDDDDDDYKDLVSSSAGSQSATQCLADSTDSDPTVAGFDHSNVKDVKWTDPVLSEPRVQLYFQSDSRGAGMKDVVREFIRKAKLALAIVMDSFSDVELLCDLLEASRKRNVSVHLLLDHLNLNLFVTMWQDLKLNSKNFPKLSVCSVDGQTYCAKTGRKLTGQIAESFIITDWTEVLTGSYSFSWLSWQVHRSLAVLVKGSAITPFHEEFHRLYSSCKPVPGFVTFIAAPHTPHLHITSHAAQNENIGISKSKSSQTKTVCHWAWNEDAQKTQTKAKMPVLTNPQSPELECNRGDNQPQHRAGTGTQTNTKPPLLFPKPLAQPGTSQSVSVEKPKHTLIGASAQHDEKTQVEPLEKNQTHVQNHSKTLGQTHVSYNQSQAAGLTAATTTTDEKNAKVQESNPLHTVNPTHGQHETVCYQSTLKKDSNLDYDSLGSEGLFFQQRNRDRLTKPSGIAAGLNTQRGQWNYSLHFKPNVELQSDNPKLLSPSTSQQQVKTGFQYSWINLRGQVSSLETRRQDQSQRLQQPPYQSYPTTEAAAMGTQLTPHLQADELFSTGTRARLHLQPLTSQQAKPPPRLNWMLQSHTARPRLVAQTSSFDTANGARQKTGGQPGWRPVHGNMNASLGRSKSLTDRHTAGFKGAGLDRT
ncbi:protein FAM83A [Seriola lalandi dorsalis]|uniref:protein FAM83A n=1 Tax=Seriola lalandi dorsalis TaxID=1841481 RepID=UPI000C6FBA13|nr:protein FAM83A [Seriola lalandi dorsalis]